MSLEDDLKAEIKEASEFRGELRQYMKSNTQWVQGIHAKLNGHLDTHSDDLKKEVADQKAAAKQWLGIGGAIAMSAGTAAWQFLSKHFK